jgi:hypothetical protein
VPPRLPPPPQQRRPAQCSPALLKSPSLQRRRLRAPCSLVEQGAALQLRQDLLDSEGWTTTSGWLPHCVPHAFIALFHGLRWRHLLHTRKTTHQQGYSCDGYSTTLVKTPYLLRRGL